jgi:putative ABC transport system permease protein
MIAPRWRKVLRDLWLNRVRTILIVLTIAVGAFAVGTIGASKVALEQQLPQRYQEIDPAHIVFTTSLFDADLVHSIESIPGVAAAEARRSLAVRMLEDPARDTWRDLAIFGVVDFADMRVYKLWHESGQWPPERGTLLMERGSLSYLNLREGQEITIKTPQGKQRTLRISGVAHDLYHMPAFIEGTVYGYVSADTLVWLGQDALYNELNVRVSGDVRDSTYMRAMTDKITRHLEGEDLAVFVTFRPQAGSYPMDYIVNTVLLLLTLLGSLILLLGGFLVINTISALIAQQARQIGVLKAIGGRSRQVLAIYLGMVLILGLLGSLLAIPLGMLGAQALTGFMADMLNYKISPDGFPLEMILMQLAVGILVPIFAALLPILGGVRKPPAQALSEYGSNQVWSGMRVMDGLLRRLPGVTRPVLLAVRNPFRRRNRLIFSLIMLALAGGSFITVLNLRSSLQQTVEDMLNFWQYDFWVDLNRPYLNERLQKEAARIPGVAEVEGWGYEMTRRVRPDGSESNPIFFFGVPPQSRMVRPTILQGRWIEAGDRNTIIIGVGLLDVEPDLGLGKEVVFKLNGKERAFRIVGVMQMLGNQTVGYMAYTGYDTFTALANKENRADMAVVRTTATQPGENLLIGTRLEKGFEDSGIEVRSVLQMESERMEIDAAFGIVIVLLMIMVLLLSAVGGLGLMGTMSLNVIERAREIGVIRAFGGANRSVYQIVILEGVVIGIISWFFSLLVAAPLTWVFCDLIGRSFLSTPLAYRYATEGALLWLAIVVILAILSSALPAANAVRLTVREVLSYE